jgi:hypothetical protein
MRRVLEQLGRYRWANHAKMSSSGRADVQRYAYRAQSECVKVVDMFKSVEAVAYNYGWSINFLTQMVIQGGTLEGKAKSKFETTRAAHHEVLADWTYPAEGGIVGCMLKYYQVQYHMVVLLGKPVKEQVVTLWISRTQWTVDTPEGKHEKYLECGTCISRNKFSLHSS